MLYSPVIREAREEYVGDKLRICTVIGFPNGYNTADVKLFETEQALKEGADEIDMVVNIGDVKEHNFEKVTDEIKLLKNACGKKVLKVIIETCLLTDEEKNRNVQSRYRRTCRLYQNVDGIFEGGRNF